MYKVTFGRMFVSLYICTFRYIMSQSFTTTADFAEFSVVAYYIMLFFIYDFCFFFFCAA